MTAPTQQQQVSVPSGLVVVTTHGLITADTTQSLVEMGRRAERIGLKGIEFLFVAGSLVDKARNEAGMRLLQSNAGFCWMIDADMSFTPDILDKMLSSAFGSLAQFDIVGGWCPLRGKPYLPTIDCGSGTWEPHDANIGPVEVIRTGGACLLIKRHVLERMEYPWFGVRPAPRSIDMMAEVDNYARCKFDGKNPLADTDAWQRLQQCAAEDAQNGRAREPNNIPWAGISSVGEDSNFCDHARAAGFRIVVNTDVVCGHVEKHVIMPEDHASAIRESRQLQRYAAGLLA